MGPTKGALGRKSLSCLLNKAIAGDIPVSLSGVLRYVRRALENFTLSKVPVTVMLSRSILFTLFTASSALQLACGLPTEQSLCPIPYVAIIFDTV